MQTIEFIGRQSVAYLKFKDMISLIPSGDVANMTPTSTISFYTQSSNNFRIEGGVHDDTSQLNMIWSIVRSSNHEYLQVSYKNESNQTDFDEALVFMEYVGAGSPILVATIIAHPINITHERSVPDNYSLGEAPMFDGKTSFGLLRTNPKLSGNLKITVDSDNKIWLNSISANKELDQSKFKKYEISKNSNYAIDVRKFLNNGVFPSDALFQVFQEDDNYLTTKNQFNQQYDNFYGYGVQALGSEFYKEDLSFFAPLWLREKLPEYFVIFKLDDPYNDSSYNGKYNFISDFIDKAVVHKVFDLREGTNIGTYIRNIVNDVNYKNNPMDLYYKNDIFSSWNGISYDGGFFSSKSQYLNSYLSEDHPVIDLENFITGGFERHKIICSNLLNLEFLFDDDESELYSINRYVGFYVTGYQLASYNIDINKVKNISSQTPEPSISSGMKLTSNKQFTQTNAEGIILPILDESLSGKIPTSEFIKSQPRVFYIQDKYNDLYNLADINTLGPILKKKKVDMSKFMGTDKLLFQSKVTRLDKGNAVLELSFDTTDDVIFAQGDYIQIEIIGLNNNLNRWRVICSSEVDPSEGYHSAEYDDLNKCYITYFSGRGGVDAVLKSLSLAINTFVTATFTSILMSNEKKVIIYNKSSSELKLRWDLATSNLLVNDVSTSSTGSQVFLGGLRKSNYSRIQVSIDDIHGLTGNEYFVTNKGYSKIKSFNICSNTIHHLPYLDKPIYEGTHIVGFADYNKYRVIEIEDDEAIEINNYKQATAFGIISVKLGLLSFHPIKDFDFDFHSTDYTKTYLDELRRYFLFKDDEYLPLYQRYKVYHGTVDFFGVTYDGTEILLNEDVDEFNTNKIQPPFDTSYEKFFFRKTSDKCKVVNQSVSEDVLGKFKGFFTLHDFISLDEEKEFTRLLDNNDPNRFVLNLIDTEYDRLRENENKTFALLSRVVPFINKWVMKGGKDIRNNPYRLNNSGAFGLYNFSPSFSIKKPTPEAFTHEWFYLDSIPTDYPIDKIANSNAYFFEAFDMNKIKSITEDYFLKYFAVGYPNEKYNNDHVIIAKDERFSFFNYNALVNESEVFFKGIRFKIKGNVASTFKDYKFSIILKHELYPIDENYTPVKYELVDNKKWKSLTLVITARFKDYKVFDGVLDYTSLYNMASNHYIDFRTTFGGTLEHDHSIMSDVPELRSVDIDETNTVKYIPISNINTGYLTNLEEELFPLLKIPIEPDSNLSNAYKLYYTYGIGKYSKIRINGKHIVQTGLVDSVNAKAINVKLDIAEDIDNDGIPDILFFALTPTLSVPYTHYDTYETMSQAFVTGQYAHYLSGGYNCYKQIMQRLSFAYFKENVISSLKATVVNIDGTIHEGSYNITVEEPELVTKYSEILPEVDSDKPQNLRIYDTIGYKMAVENNTHNIYRYNGKYEPKFKEVLPFQVREDDNVVNYFENEFLLHNTKFFIDHPNFGIIKNFYFNKVSDSEILKLSKDNAYISVYPKVSEVSIDKKDFNIFSSSWDKNYYRLYTDVDKYTDINGYTELIEEKSFLGSKTMIVPKKVSLEKFKSSELGVDNTADIIWTVENNIMKATINLENKILNHFISEGATTEFNNLVNTVGGGDPVVLAYDYLRKNMLNLYNISNITTWEVENTTLPTINSDLSEADKIRLGYKKSPNIKVTKVNTFTFTIEKIMDSRKTHSFAFSITVQKI